MSKPFVVIISGVAGSGKDTLIEELWSHPELFEVAVSYTDRPIRPGEIEDKNYHYISKTEFDTGIRKKEFVEWETVRGEYRYGRKKADLKRAFRSGKTVIMSAEPLGMLKFKKIYDVASIFIMPPSLDVAIERLKKRGNDTADGLKNRTDRYRLEMSYKNRYDRVIINDDLETAQKELLHVIKEEKENHQRLHATRKAIFGLVAIFLLTGSAYAYNYSIRQEQAKNIAVAFPPGVSGSDTDDQPDSDQPESDQPDTDSAAVTPSPLPSAEAKKKVTTTPPKTPTNEEVAATTTKNSDGSTTTTVSTGGVISQTELNTLQNSTAIISSPLNIPYIDQTGSYGDLGTILKNYLNSTLKWQSEISEMRGIIVENAGATGWNGQYLGSYITSSSGKISSAEGIIVLNTYYIETQYCTGSNNFDGCPNEYAKLVLSHEYGHHYTLYHKWLDWNLGNGVRFPDSYYSIRPLTKLTTAPDYSLGWSNCDAEIIAEDYSYLYSGYGLQAMHSTYGYPSAATKSWLDNIGSVVPTTIVPVNTAPIITITSPSNGATLSGSVDFTATATDDVGVANVSFYINDNLIVADTSSPYSTTLSTTGYQNGDYVLKAVASDGSLSSTSSITVHFANTIVDATDPTISILSPTDNPYTLTGTSLNMSIVATDNIAVDRIEFYFNDSLQKSWSVSTLNLKVSFRGLSAGTYTLTFKAYDAAGNSSDTKMTVVKP
ncbi:hypothetical protein COT78_00940 [Candidatus Berkelbacteria bacterium CG10_big_fil_rev_8_21_14_0_10_43_13]|uniref:Guanylate kinase-like domain-containing protein n=1 Tax=Candidatus Berkelbacteria bacterium CG10_big_fil_rev_8_21_14_0_10_43_13 TaxID=1974514 RepID=A0A2H0W746_9BACT|nr:MAG: hypothetical protein COT78_00940 [Candidatus Berkelbacteria bacterium CG10_big_fil_rev_8_21_14_0_10_43_13]